jgi:hypothetical protein
MAQFLSLVVLFGILGLAVTFLTSRGDAEGRSGRE